MTSSEERSRHKTQPYKRAGLALVVAVVSVVSFCLASFRGDFVASAPLTVVSVRSGLVLDVGSKVKLHGVEIGRVAGVSSTGEDATIDLDINPSMLEKIPANVGAEIKPTTIFGTKYVELVAPEHPDSAHLIAGAQIDARHVTTEINTVFEDLVEVMNKIEPDKLNATLTAISDGLQGRGAALGETISDLDQTLTQLNPQLPQLQVDLRGTAAAASAFGDAGDDLLSILRNVTVTSGTIVDDQKNLAALLVSAIGFGSTGHTLLAEDGPGIINSLRLLAPTTNLLDRYSPSFPCLFHLGALDTINEAAAINKTDYSVTLDTGLLLPKNPYAYPENLPIVAAKNGPHGRPGCYSPATWNTYPAPYLRMNTGAPLNGPGTDHPTPAQPTVVEYLFGNALLGKGRP